MTTQMKSYAAQNTAESANKLENGMDVGKTVAQYAM
jgi:hypothetical protein